MIIRSRGELLEYFKARTPRQLEAQFNADGRPHPVLIDVSGPDVLIATQATPGHRDSGEPALGLSTMTFPFHVSDFLGRIELDRRSVEAAVRAT